MKKLLIAALTVAMILSMAACGKKEETNKEEQVGLPNPNVEYDSLEAINKEIGCNIPGTGAMGTTDQSYIVINKAIAQYSFTQGGCKYTYRASKTADDISGIYENGKTVFADFLNEKNYLVLALNNGMIARWFDGDMQYCLYKENSATGEPDLDGFISLCADQIAQTCPQIGDFFTKLEGNYYESIAQRATVEAKNYGDSATVNVFWPSSAYEYDLWNLVVVKDGTHYAYTQGMHSRVKFNEKGEQLEPEILETDLEGYFELTSEGLVWSGTKDASAKDTLFIKE